jgi:hypothetical protein
MLLLKGTLSKWMVSGSAEKEGMDKNMTNENSLKLAIGGLLLDKM